MIIITYCTQIMGHICSMAVSHGTQAQLHAENIKVRRGLESLATSNNNA